MSPLRYSLIGSNCRPSRVFVPVPAVAIRLASDWLSEPSTNRRDWFATESTTSTR